jgi:hypothetical protein
MNPHATVKQTRQGFILHNRWGLPLELVNGVYNPVKRKFIGWQNGKGVVFCWGGGV